MPPRRKWIGYGTVLALCAAGLFVDRVLLPQPDEASADGTDVASPSAPQPKTSPPRAAADPQSNSNQAPGNPDADPASPIAQWLRQWPDVAETRDPFSSSNLPAMRNAEAKTEADISTKDQIADFIGTHVLQGTYQDHGQSFALVGGQILAVGQVVDGFRLVRVEPYKAIFENGGESAALVMEADPGRHAPSAK